LKLSIILPVYNPANGWAAIVISKSKELKALYPDLTLETIVVNDGSTSITYTSEKDTLQSADVTLIEYYPNQGKGEAIRTGVRAAGGDLIVYTDIDFPYTISSVCQIIDRLKQDQADVALGIKDSSYYSHVPPVRRFISRFLRMLIRLFFRIPTDDTQCGLKGFNKKAQPVFLQTTIKRYLFDLEFIFTASRDRGLRIQTIPVQLNEGVEFRKMSFGILRSELWNFLKVFLKALIGR
jgi:glycosyltransferase involved in cell wall biosynthesis